MATLGPRPMIRNVLIALALLAAVLLLAILFDPAGVGLVGHADAIPPLVAVSPPPPPPGCGAGC